ncbi:MAG: hypothetical protein QM765_26965 [Myxococcales bacterium]
MISGFLDEEREDFVLLHQLGAQHLERHLAAEDVVAHLPDARHAALAQEAQVRDLPAGWSRLVQRRGVFRLLAEHVGSEGTAAGCWWGVGPASTPGASLLT